MKPPYTPRQGQFLAFIHHYTTLHGRPPAEAETHGSSAQRLRQYACKLFHHNRQTAMPETTFEESMTLMLNHLPDLPVWREAMSLGRELESDGPVFQATGAPFRKNRAAEMTDIQQRNRRILQLSREGIGFGEIAGSFRLSRTTIDRIVRRFEDERRLAEKHGELLAQIRQAEDLDAIWPANDLIDIIQPLPVIVTRLKEHFESLNSHQISLRLLMDMTIPDNGTVGEAPFSPPLLQVAGVGKKGYWSMVHRLTNLDFGGKFEQIWLERVAMLRRFWNMNGPLPDADRTYDSRPK